MELGPARVVWALVGMELELEPDGLGSMDIGNLVPWAADGLSEVPQQGRSRLAGDPLVESGVEERVGGCAMAPRSMVSWAWIMALHFELCLRQSVLEHAVLQ